MHLHESSSFLFVLAVVIQFSLDEKPITSDKPKSDGLGTLIQVLTCPSTCARYVGAHITCSIIIDGIKEKLTIKEAAELSEAPTGNLSFWNLVKAASSELRCFTFFSVHDTSGRPRSIPCRQELSRPTYNHGLYGSEASALNTDVILPMLMMTNGSGLIQIALSILRLLTPTASSDGIRTPLTGFCQSENPLRFTGVMAAVQLYARAPAFWKTHLFSECEYQNTASTIKVYKLNVETEKLDVSLLDLETPYLIWQLNRMLNANAWKCASFLGSLENLHLSTVHERKIQPNLMTEAERYQQRIARMNAEYKLGNAEKLTVTLRVLWILEISLASRNNKPEACITFELQVAQIVIAVTIWLSGHWLIFFTFFSIQRSPNSLVYRDSEYCVDPASATAGYESFHGINETANRRRTIARKINPNWGVKVLKLRSKESGKDAAAKITNPMLVKLSEHVIACKPTKDKFWQSRPQPSTRNRLICEHLPEKSVILNFTFENDSYTCLHQFLFQIGFFREHCFLTITTRNGVLQVRLSVARLIDKPPEKSFVCPKVMFLFTPEQRRGELNLVFPIVERKHQGYENDSTKIKKQACREGYQCTTTGRILSGDSG
ncbi:hypothetical protein CLF_102422 [Clonorchis sinensis]|uniref:Uncharacterized protein n=1 Tax=Clonorchis sinensis TaxID=79923 RepID=G7Y7W6_CLOSI|nr:hypothetical protein CLF_102422 [Clonorchis sinensis]